MSLRQRIEIWLSPGARGKRAFLRQLEANRSCPDTPVWDATHRIADRMAACPNNPRNGGAGFDGQTTCPWGFDIDDTDAARRRHELGLAKDPLERLRREIRWSNEELLNAGTRHQTLLGLRGRLCRYSPDNGGCGRRPGDPRHFEDYVEDVLGDDWGDDEAAAAFVAARDERRFRCCVCDRQLTRETAVPAGVEGREHEVFDCELHGTCWPTRRESR